ncbi:ATP-binding protein [Actinoplanes xinjiangensis]|uniref:ATP-binding protein n=1 Tax=Actinoplanes xinjiangensis TaxID=512350 RepID=UPI0034402720
MTYDVVNPDPAGTIVSLRSLGYSVEAAIADLVDNSVAAGARNVDTYFTWSGSDSWIAVVDNGIGMDRDGLVTAMTIAAQGSFAERREGDLGRFGMGLKSASFSQAQRLTVASRSTDGTTTIRTWDLSVVTGSGEWRLLHGTDDHTAELLATLLPRDQPSGTAVVWRSLHRYDIADLAVGDEKAQTQFYGEATRVEEHLGMVFARFLNGRRRLTMTVNGTPVRPWDPFASRHPAIQSFPPEEIPIDGHVMKIAAYVLPHPSRLGDSTDEIAGPGGWLDRQGFYVYRRDRLILAGDWLGLRKFRRDERFNLARISVDVPAEADAAWSVDVRKSTAVPPVGARRHLQRIGEATRRRAAEVLSHRGRIAARKHAPDFAYAWQLDTKGGRIRCRVNREHPLVREVLRGGADDSKDARALIRLLEETFPMAALRIMQGPEIDEAPEPFRGSAPEEMITVADRIYQALVSQGSTPNEAKQRVGMMPPFDQFDGFWHGK